MRDVADGQTLRTFPLLREAPQPFLEFIATRLRTQHHSPKDEIVGAIWALLTADYRGGGCAGDVLYYQGQCCGGVAGRGVYVRGAAGGDVFRGDRGAVYDSADGERDCADAVPAASADGGGAAGAAAELPCGGADDPRDERGAAGAAGQAEGGVLERAAARAPGRRAREHPGVPAVPRAAGGGAALSCAVCAAAGVCAVCADHSAGLGAAGPRDLLYRVGVCRDRGRGVACGQGDAAARAVLWRARVAGAGPAAHRQREGRVADRVPASARQRPRPGHAA
ncbi:hypothetical protein NEOLI_005422, partial [Neolecta irregularis DAH-3]